MAHFWLVVEWDEGFWVRVLQPNNKYRCTTNLKNTDAPPTWWCKDFHKNVSIQPVLADHMCVWEWLFSDQGRGWLGSRISVWIWKYMAEDRYWGELSKMHDSFLSVTHMNKANYNANWSRTFHFSYSCLGVVGMGGCYTLASLSTSSDLPSLPHCLFNLITFPNLILREGF